MRDIDVGADVATTQACGRCGSTLVRRVQYGMPTSPDVEPGTRLGGCVIMPGLPLIQCLTCGQSGTLFQTRGEDWVERPAGDSTVVAAAVTRFADQLRGTTGTSDSEALSPLGLWLLLALVAPLATGPRRDRLGEVLGLPVADAQGYARNLLAEPHPTVAAALGAWSAEPVPSAAVDIASPVPEQSALDAWAIEQTRGLIERFPVQVDAETLVVLATALVLEPRWAHGVSLGDDGWLRLDAGFFAVLDTQAAGLVAVAKPRSQDGVDVLSVIAAPDVAPDLVWAAVDEVVVRLESGELWGGEHEGDEKGHAWREETALRFVARDELDGWGDGPTRWTARLPEWSAETSTDLSRAPGVAEVVAAIDELVPGAAEAARCVKSAVAEYDEDGFSAAAVTAMAVAGGAPDGEMVEGRTIELDFDRPHAVIAIARGGAWEGVPLFTAWVTPER